MKCTNRHQANPSKGSDLHYAQQDALAKARGLGASRSGFAPWWAQRWTAVVNLPLSIFIVWWVSTQGIQRSSLETLTRGSWAGYLMAMALTLTIVFFGYHGYLGCRVIIEDYIKKEVIKYALLLTTGCLFILLGLLGMSWLILPFTPPPV